MFATAIHADVPFAGLHDYLRKELACWGLGLDADGFITGPYRGPDGIYAIVPPEEHEGRPWHHAVHPCPFVGPLVGYLRWETWEDMSFNSDFPSRSSTPGAAPPPASKTAARSMRSPSGAFL